MFPDSLISILFVNFAVVLTCGPLAHLAWNGPMKFEKKAQKHLFVCIFRDYRQQSKKEVISKYDKAC